MYRDISETTLTNGMESVIETGSTKNATNLKLTLVHLRITCSGRSLKTRYYLFDYLGESNPRIHGPNPLEPGPKTIENSGIDSNKDQIFSFFTHGSISTDQSTVNFVGDIFNKSVRGVMADLRPNS